MTILSISASILSSVNWSRENIIFHANKVELFCLVIISDTQNVFP